MSITQTVNWTSLNIFNCGRKIKGELLRVIIIDNTLCDEYIYPKCKNCKYGSLRREINPNENKLKVKDREFSNDIRLLRVSTDALLKAAEKRERGL